MFARVYKTATSVTTRRFSTASVATEPRVSTAAPPQLRDFAPPEPTAAAHSLRQQHVELLKKFIEDKKVIFITGAGISTESGLPDYRSPRGSYSKGHKPITFQEFMGSDYHRRRYWARSFTAFHLFSGTKPNAAHLALAQLEARLLETTGRPLHIITQNVDGLHQRAGSSSVLELHGHLRSVKCMSCGNEVKRKEYQQKLEELNHTWLDMIQHQHLNQSGSPATRADGDVDLGSANYEHFHVCGCDKCGGIMKPVVVFFGENVLPEVAKRSYEWVDEAEAVVVAGSSLQVFSAFRLIRKATEKGTPYGIINIGPTRGDEHAAFKIQDRLGEILPAVTSNL